MQIANSIDISCDLYDLSAVIACMRYRVAAYVVLQIGHLGGLV